MKCMMWWEILGYLVPQKMLIARHWNTYGHLPKNIRDLLAYHVLVLLSIVWGDLSAGSKLYN